MPSMLLKKASDSAFIMESRKTGLWDLGATADRRFTIGSTNIHKKSNSELEKMERNRAATLEEAVIRNMPKQQQKEQPKSKYSLNGISPIYRSASDYSTAIAQAVELAKSSAATQELRQRFQKEDEERTPLIANSSHAIENPKSYGGGGQLILPLEHVQQKQRQRESEARKSSSRGLRVKPKYSVEQSVFLEEDEEINDEFGALPVKSSGSIWTRFSQKAQKTDRNLVGTKSAPDQIYRPLQKLSIGQQKSPVLSSCSATLTTGSSSRVTRSPDTGFTYTRGATTAEAENANSQRVHANRCELYINRMILLCILSGFVLFFVGSMSFVAYVLTEKSYEDGVPRVNESQG